MLKTDKAKDLKNINWLEYFKQNNNNLIPLNFKIKNELSKKEIKLISTVLKTFQLGESSEAIHLKKIVKSYTYKTNDFKFIQEMNYFISEENRHSKILKRFMEIYNIKTIEKSFLDNIFTFLRRLINLEFEIIVLNIAEIIANPFYTCLHNCTNSTLLKTICKQILNDENYHLIFHSHRLFIMYKNRNTFLNIISILSRIIILLFSCNIVYFRFRKVFLKGGYNYKKFINECIEYSNQSIKISLYCKY